MDKKSSMVMVAARIGLGLILVFLVPVTAMFHGPWTAQGAEVQLQVIQLLKNLSIAGGLLAVAAAGPGLFSLDERRARGAKAARASWKAVRAS